MPELSPAPGPVLILGGTAEARALAAALVDAGVPRVSSLAGRVRDPALPAGEVRIGGFGGVDGLAAWLRDHDVAAVVDATHPFASTMTAHAVDACAAAGVPLVVLRRPGWPPEPGWVWADSLAAAAAAAAVAGRARLPHHRAARASRPSPSSTWSSWSAASTRRPGRCRAGRACCWTAARSPSTASGR